MSRSLALLALVALCAARPARAYNEALHALMTARALEGHAEWRAEELAPPSEADLKQVRALFWRAGAALPDAALRAKFLARFPTEEALDGWAFKELLMLDPAATVHGFDVVAGDQQPLKRFELLSRAARWPDDDARNRNRYLRDGKHEVVKAADGSATPYDPITLQLGALSGGTSQGHAHYGLLLSGYSDDPKVLQTDPRHFAIPPGVKAFGCDFAQLYTDLALLADGAGVPSSRWLSVAFAGAAFHHLEDVANQIHTVQVGTYEFFKSAYLQSKLRDVATLGGVLGARRSLRQIGLRLVANHHLFLEDLWAKRVAEAAAGGDSPAEVRAAVAGLQADDPAFAPLVRAALAGSAEPGRALCQQLVETSSHEGPEVYKLAWALSVPELREYPGHEYKHPPDDPDQFLSGDAAHGALLKTFYELEGRGLTRAGTVLRAWQGQHDAAAQHAEGQRVAAVQRMLAFLLPYHEAAAARRARYVPDAPDSQPIAWAYPLAALALLALVALGIRRAIR